MEMRSEFGGYSILPLQPDGSHSKLNPKQMLLFLEEMPPDLRSEMAHWHDLDIVLNVGTSGSGKSIGAVARSLYIAKTWPGASIIYASTTFKHLEKSALQDFKKILSTPKGAWKHPFVRSAPNQQSKALVISNKAEDGREFEDSTILFLGVGQDPTVLLSLKSDLCIIEESQRILDKSAFDVLITRMRSVACPWKQIILNANPHEDGADWLYEFFRLEQYQDNYAGPIEPAGPVCECQKCEVCESEYINGVCPACGWTKRSLCPGKQHYSRVIQSSITDNLANVPSSYRRDMAGTLSGANLDAYSRGKISAPKGGRRVYENFGPHNVNKENPPIDPTKDIILHLDFNLKPNSSGISQVDLIDGVKHVFVKGEIYVWNADVDAVAQRFVEKMSRIDLPLDAKIKLYGDPTGRNGDVSRDKFYRIQKWLRECGYRNVHVRARSKPFEIQKRVNAVNDMLRKNDAKGNTLVRLHVNENCEWHLRSLSGTIWNKQGTKEDERNDKKARDRANPGEPLALTHFAAGLGYFIASEFPSVPQSAHRTPHIHASISPFGGGSILTQDDEGEVIERSFDELERQLKACGIEFPDDDDPDDEELSYVYRPPEVQKPEPYREPSIADYWRRQGMWGPAAPSRYDGTL